MRLWSMHPRYLDPQGLVAVWREGLLAQAVIAGRTRGYRHHPQLQRFRAHAEPQSAVCAYLTGIYDESCTRGYCFDANKLGPRAAVAPIPLTSGQLAYEWAHLLRKLEQRHPELYARWAALPLPEPHPLFRVQPGPIEDWERETA